MDLFDFLDQLSLKNNNKIVVPLIFFHPNVNNI